MSGWVKQQTAVEDQSSAGREKNESSSANILATIGGIGEGATLQLQPAASAAAMGDLQDVGARADSWNMRIPAVQDSSSSSNRWCRVRSNTSSRSHSSRGSNTSIKKGFIPVRRGRGFERNRSILHSTGSQQHRYVARTPRLAAMRCCCSCGKKGPMADVKYTLPCCLLPFCSCACYKLHRQQHHKGIPAISNEPNDELDDQQHATGGTEESADVTGSGGEGHGKIGLTTSGMTVSFKENRAEVNGNEAQMESAKAAETPKADTHGTSFNVWSKFKAKGILVKTADMQLLDSTAPMVEVADTADILAGVDDMSEGGFFNIESVKSSATVASPLLSTAAREALSTADKADKVPNLTEVSDTELKDENEASRAGATAEANGACDHVEIKSVRQPSCYKRVERLGWGLGSNGLASAATAFSAATGVPEKAQGVICKDGGLPACEEGADESIDDAELTLEEQAILRHNVEIKKLLQGSRRLRHALKQVAEYAKNEDRDYCANGRSSKPVVELLAALLSDPLFEKFCDTIMDALRSATCDDDP